MEWSLGEKFRTCSFKGIFIRQNEFLTVKTTEQDELRR